MGIVRLPGPVKGAEVLLHGGTVQTERGCVVMQVPYIEDPNTGTAMFESNEIVKYLNDTYAV